MSALVIFTTIYGVVGALSGLFQLQRMYRTASAEDISLRFFLIYFGGYLVWLYYGIVTQDIALIVVDAVGIFIGGGTISYAIYLRVTEGGQRIIDALFDRSVTARGAWSLSSNSSQEDKGPRPPESLKSVVYSPIYPLRRVKRTEKDPATEAIASLGTDNEKQHFFAPVATWREVDGGRDNWQDWRRHLAHALDYLQESDIKSPAAEVVLPELARKVSSRPSPERLAYARTVFVLSLVEERRRRYPRDRALPQISEQVNHPRGFLASEQRWLEQLMATFYLPEKTLKEPALFLRTQEGLPREIKRTKKTFVIEGAWEDLLWPVQAGINDYWGSPKAMNYPIIKSSWLKEKNEAAILSATLKGLRQRDPSARRYFFIHPLEYSMQNGWQALLLDSSLGHTPWYFPMEKTFILALARTIGISKNSQVISLINNLDLGYTALELARMSGIGFDALIDIYQDNYKKIAKRCLPIHEGLDERRIEESWLRYLS